MQQPWTCTEARPSATQPASRPVLPPARGELSEELFGRLRTSPGDDWKLPPMGGDSHSTGRDHPLWGDDHALALYCCYEQHYRSFAGVDDAWEWDPSLLRARRQLEVAFESCLRDEVCGVATGTSYVEVLHDLARSDGPSLSAYMEKRGSLQELCEFAVHRSAYQLKEADPHTWAIPRFAGASKSALVAIQQDEYGEGRPGALHSDLYAETLRALDLDETYGAYLDRIPGTTLATVNLMSFFGLHRRMRGAAVGHLALFEMTSVAPMARYARAMRRHAVVGGVEFFDVHVDVDGDHERVALERLCRSVVSEDPVLAGDIVFGAVALDLVERRFAGHLLDCWSDGRSSLRAPMVSLHAVG